MCVLLATLFFSLVVSTMSQQALGWKDKELSFSSEGGEYHYRSLSTATWSLLNYNGVWYHSLETDVNTKEPKAEGNFIWGSIYIGRNKFPINWQGYWAASASANRTVDPTKANWESFDVSFTSSFVACAYLRLYETNVTSGEEVAHENLDSLWSYDAATSQLMTNKTAGLYANVFRTTLDNGATVEIQYILTKESGVLDVLEGVEVVPKAVETIVVISNWPYVSEANTLSLVMAAGSADMSVSTSGQASSGSGDTGVFFRVAKSAQVDGKMGKVGVTVESSTDVAANFGNGVAVQLNQRYGKSASCGLFTATFPAGAKEIVYDPTMGSGEDPFADENTALIIGISVACVVAFVLLAIGAFVYYRRRAAYSSI